MISGNFDDFKTLIFNKRTERTPHVCESHMVKPIAEEKG